MKMSMKARMTLTESFESSVLKAYCKDDGVWTIGYGHTATVYPSLVITKETADILLQGDISYAENAVNYYVHAVLNQNQFDAIVDFVFNVGRTAFAESHMLLFINRNQFDLAADEFEKWDHIKAKVVAGLLRRRIAERDLFEEHYAAS